MLVLLIGVTKKKMDSEYNNLCTRIAPARLTCEVMMRKLNFFNSCKLIRTLFCAFSLRKVTTYNTMSLGRKVRFERGNNRPVLNWILNELSSLFMRNQV